MRGYTETEQKSREFLRWKAWDEFLEVQDEAGFRQSSWYTAFKVSYNGWNHFATMLKGGESIVGGAVIFTRSYARDKCYYYIPDGPTFLGSDSDAEQEQVFRTIMAFIDRKRQSEQQVVSHLCINPRWDHVPGFVKGFQDASHFYGSPRDTQCIDLQPPEGAILAQMKPKGRYNIGVARRYGVSVVEDVSPQGSEDFLNIFEETCARKNLEGQDAEFFQTLIPILSAADRGSIFFAEYQGMRIAAALVVYSGRTATYYFGGSRTVHRNVMAPYLLHFEIMRKAKSLGCHYYDLMGVTPQGEPDNSWTEISVFKRKFGGQERRLVPTLEYVYDPDAYREWDALERNRRNDRRARRAELARQATQAGGEKEGALASGAQPPAGLEDPGDDRDA